MKKKTHKGKKIEVTFWPNDLELLQQYSKQTGLTRAVAIRHLVREGLKEYSVEEETFVAPNQLDLFDSLQIDIFNNTSKTE